jgi:hypothetical protein
VSQQTPIAASLIWYDIPKVGGQDVFPNPSPTLRQYGVRVGYSDWCIPDHRIPYNFLHEMTQGGVRWNSLQFKTDTAEQLAHLIKTVVDGLKESARDAINSSQRKASEAAEAYTNSDDSPDRAAKAYLYTVSAATKKAAVILGDLSKCASGFGIDFDLSTAFGMVKTIQTLCVARARVYAEATRAVKLIGQLDGMADAARKNALPWYIMSDYLRDAGEDEIADSLRAAFFGE